MRGWASRSLIWLPNFLLGSLFWTSRLKKLKWHIWCQTRVTSKDIPKSHFMIVIISVRWVLKWHCAIKIKFQISSPRFASAPSLLTNPPALLTSNPLPRLWKETWRALIKGLAKSCHYRASEPSKHKPAHGRTPCPVRVSQGFYITQGELIGCVCRASVQLHVIATTLITNWINIFIWFPSVNSTKVMRFQAVWLVECSIKTRGKSSAFLGRRWEKHRQQQWYARCRVNGKRERPQHVQSRM